MEIKAGDKIKLIELKESHDKNFNPISEETEIVINATVIDASNRSIKFIGVGDTNFSEWNYYPEYEIAETGQCVRYKIKTASFPAVKV